MKTLKETVGAIGLLATLLLSQGCAGWGGTACKIVDAAQTACTVVKYLGPDGKEREVRVSREEFQEFGREMSTKRAAEKLAP